MLRLLSIATICLLPAAPLAAQPVTDAPAGTYHLDPSHTRLLFKVDHLGFSHYTAMFLKFDADLTFDPQNPETMHLKATVDPASVETHYPDAAVDFNAVIAGADFLDAAQYPAITYESTSIRLTGEQTAEVTGNLNMHGVTKPVVLNVTFNGGYAGHPLDSGARIGFSATGTLLRSDFGIAYGIPEPGSKMGVSDEVQIIIETELLNPDAPKVAAP